jgi:hypothetical protein
LLDWEVALDDGIGDDEGMLDASNELDDCWLDEESMDWLAAEELRGPVDDELVAKLLLGAMLSLETVALLDKTMLLLDNDEPTETETDGAAELIDDVAELETNEDDTGGGTRGHCAQSPKRL